MTNLTVQRPTSDPSAGTPRPTSGTTGTTGSAALTRTGTVKQEAVHPAPQAAKAAMSSDELKNLASEIQRKVAVVASDLQFSVDEETGKDLIRVTDRTTKKIVWQFPSEEALNITKALDQYQKGVMLNHRA